MLARMFGEGLDGFEGGLSAANYLSLTKTSTAKRDPQDLEARARKCGARGHAVAASAYTGGASAPHLASSSSSMPATLRPLAPARASAHNAGMSFARGPYAVLVRMAAIWALVFNLAMAGWMTGAHAAAPDPLAGHYVICTMDGAMQAPEGGGAPLKAPSCDCTLCAAFHALAAVDNTPQGGAGWRFLARLGGTRDALAREARALKPNNRGPPALT